MDTVIFSESAPAPIGPYSQGRATGAGLVFLSGQIPLDASGSVVGAGITEQTTQVLENIGHVLAAAGLTFVDVVKTTVYLRDMSEFPAMNAVYAKYFTDNKPARSTVEVSRLPKDVQIEIEVIATTRA